MSNKIELEVKLCKEDRERVDALIGALVGSHSTIQPEPLTAPQTDKSEPVEPVSQPAEKVQESEPQSPPPWEEDKPEAPTCSKEDVRKKVVELSAAGKKDEVRQIVKSYAEKVSAIPEDKLDEVMEQLNALEG